MHFIHVNNNTTTTATTTDNSNATTHLYCVIYLIIVKQRRLIEQVQENRLENVSNLGELYLHMYATEKGTVFRLHLQRYCWA